MSSSEQESVAPALDEETRDVLREAKSYIAAGWWQGELSPDGKHVCLVGSIAKVRGITGEGGWLEAPVNDDPAIQALVETMGFDHPEFAIGELIAWNDAPERCVDEVIDLFDQALLRLARCRQREAG